MAPSSAMSSSGAERRVFPHIRRSFRAAGQNGPRRDRLRLELHTPGPCSLRPRWESPSACLCSLVCLFACLLFIISCPFLRCSFSSSQNTTRWPCSPPSATGPSSSGPIRMQQGRAYKHYSQSLYKRGRATSSTAYQKRERAGSRSCSYCR